MRTIVILLSIFFLTTSQAQKKDFEVLLDSAKILFKKERTLSQEELKKFDYYKIVSLLDKVIELKPKNTEARYFLGYTYSRINAKDGRGMIDMNLDLLHKTSKQFEKVIKLTPKYEGEMIVLDPYSKITSEWGSMAMSYWYKGKTDIAVSTFKEGKKRGGFSDYILEVNKTILDACSKNAILISSGDSFSIPLWYLQMVENYRTDVSVIDISLLNTKWYPTFLSNSKSVTFDLTNKTLDTIEYKKWSDTKITINDFSWIVKPSYYNEYLLRGDQIFLSLLKKNKFKRELYFTIGARDAEKLSLKDYLTSHCIIDKLSIIKNEELSFNQLKKSITKILKLSKKINKNSTEELDLLDSFRAQIFFKIDAFFNKKNKEKSKQLLILLDKYDNLKKYPYQDKQITEYYNYLKEKVFK